jgi:hypothetical protein
MLKTILSAMLALALVAVGLAAQDASRPDDAAAADAVLTFSGAQQPLLQTGWQAASP